jgi:hypothetical protein
MQQDLVATNEIQSSNMVDLYIRGKERNTSYLLHGRANIISIFIVYLLHNTSTP